VRKKIAALGTLISSSSLDVAVVYNLLVFYKGRFAFIRKFFSRINVRIPLMMLGMSNAMEIDEVKIESDHFEYMLCTAILFKILISFLLL
jgi:hypothetical protein